MAKSHAKHSQRRGVAGRPTGVIGGNVHRCSRKNAYNKRVALAVARKLRRKTGEEIRHYCCPDCGAWHVGHPPGSKGSKGAKGA